MTEHHRRPKRLAALAVLVALAATSALVTAAVVPQRSSIAFQGPLPVHRELAGQPSFVPDAPPPTRSAQPATVQVPVGPHLTVPILYYHYIRAIAPTPQNLAGFYLSISPQLFAEQMALLHVEGAHTITLETLMKALQGRTTLPSHPVVLTFDDGYADFATAAEPVLERYGFTATDYVVSGFVGHFHYMSAAQVRAMAAAGMVIGSHTVDHVNLAAESPARAQAEIDGGKAALERLLGRPVLDFAYPYGAYSPAVVALVKQAGFRDAVSTMPGDTQILADCFLFHRTELGGAPGLAEFAADAALDAPSASQLELVSSLASMQPSPKSA